MRIPILYCILTLVFTSCAPYTYFYSTMNSDDPYTFKNSLNDFYQTTDSVYVIYSFAGENAPITIDILNKKNKPIYVDWKKSGIVMDDSGEFDEKTVFDDERLIDFGQYMSDPEKMTRIRPGHSELKQVLELTNFNFRKIPDNQFVKRHTSADAAGDNRKMKSIRYSVQDSPVYLQTYLTVYDNASRSGEPLVFHTDFYMKELSKSSSLKPDEIYAIEKGQGDTFFVQVEKNKTIRKVGNLSLEILGGTLIVGGGIILDVLAGVDAYDN